MQYVKLGTTGLEVSELCYGTLVMGWQQGAVPVEEGALAIRRGVDFGINFFDTAQVYRTYEHMSAGLKGVTEAGGRPLIFASKTFAKTFEEAQAAVEEALRGLGRDHLEIFLLHNVNSPQEFAERTGALEYLLRAKEQGLIGHLGVSTHSAPGVLVTLDHPELEVVLPIVNQVGRGLRIGTMAEMIEATQRAHAAGKGTYAMKVLAGGHLAADFEANLKWARQLDCLDAITVGMKTVAEVEADVAVFEDREVPPSAHTLASLKKVRIVPTVCSGCGTCVDICPGAALKVGSQGIAECDHSRCVLCGYCGSACPKFAIRLV